MDNFANLMSTSLVGINQYADIFNTIAQARKLMMEPTGNPQEENLNAARSVAGALLNSGWNRGDHGILIRNLSQQTIIDLEDYILEEDPSPITEDRMRQLIADITNYIDNNDDNGAAAAAGGRRRKSKKSRKNKKSRKSKKSRKNKKSRKH